MTTDSKLIPIAAYARTNSSNTTGSHCGSIQDQLNAISYWAKYNNCRVVKEYKDECISGFKKCPPDLIWLANNIESKRIQVEFVVVCQVSRISRNIKVSMWFQKELEISNIKLISLSDSCRYHLSGTC
jgi:DNA invertase Pin-like site-specific DNA recombinase